MRWRIEKEISKTKKNNKKNHLFFQLRRRCSRFLLTFIKFWESSREITSLLRPWRMMLLMENTSVNRRNEAIITTERVPLDMPVISLASQAVAHTIAQFNLIVNFFNRNFRKSECQLLIKLFTSLQSTKTSFHLQSSTSSFPVFRMCL